MAYSDFTFSKVKEAFQLTIDEKTNLFANTPKVQPSQILTTLLQENRYLFVINPTINKIAPIAKQAIIP
jgi:hypothetical protein